MQKPVVITVAITGAVPRKEDNPAVPIIPSEQVESTHEAFEAGASLVHIHVRELDQRPSSRVELYLEVMEGVRRHCPGMIIQFSTGGRGRSLEHRGDCLQLQPDMASLATGSVNFLRSVYENPPEFVDALAAQMLKHAVKPEVEVFDSAMLYNAAALEKRGLLKGPAHVQFVMGIPNAMPARRSLLEFLVGELAQLLPGATWTAAGIGRHQFEVAQWALELGGHCRTGLEDNLRISSDALASSNAELVKQIADVAATFGRRPASPSQARTTFGLRPF